MLIVKVDVPVAPEVRMTEIGLNVTVTPGPEDAVLNSIVPTNPFRDAKVTVEDPDVPATRVMVVGDALMAKSGSDWAKAGASVKPRDSPPTTRIASMKSESLSFLVFISPKRNYGWLHLFSLFCQEPFMPSKQRASA